MQILELLTLVSDLANVYTELSSFITSESDFKLGIIIFGYLGNSKKQKKTTI